MSKKRKKKPGRTTRRVPKKAPSRKRPSATRRTAKITKPLQAESFGALVQGPEKVFCYWEVDGKTTERIRKLEGRPVLRIWRPGGELRDADVEPGPGKTYLNGKAGTRIRLQLGLVLPDGSYIPMSGLEDAELPSRQGMESHHPKDRALRGGDAVADAPKPLRRRGARRTAGPKVKGRNESLPPRLPAGPGAARRASVVELKDAVEKELNEHLSRDSYTGNQDSGK